MTGHQAHDDERRAPWLRIAAVRGVVRRHGWRAYAVPLLALLTVAVVVQSSQSSPRSASADPAPRGSASAAPQPSTSAAAPSATNSAADAVQAAPVATPCTGTADPQLVVVNLSTQHAWMCAGGTDVRDTPVTTGQVSNGNDTPTGTWQVYAKESERYLTGPGYSDFVHFWVPFNGDFGFHDASWQTMPFGSPDYVTQGSHGCVHVPTDVMAWMYDWITVGATVTITA